MHMDVCLQCSRTHIRIYSDGRANPIRYGYTDMAKKVKTTYSGRRKRRYNKRRQRRLFCSCKQPQSEGWIVECARCSKWYHGDCIGFPERFKQHIIESYCGYCSQKFNLKTKIRPLCGVEACEEFSRPDSAFCSDDHAREFYEWAVNNMQTDGDVQIANWLAQKSNTDLEEFVNATSDRLPDPQPDADHTNKALRERLQKAEEARSTTQICGWDPSYLSDSQDIVPGCQTPIANCKKHRNWPQMVAARINGRSLSERERKAPDPAWVLKRSKRRVPGTVRLHDTFRMESKNYIPYIWESGNREYYLDGDPEPFWEAHC